MNKPPAPARLDVAAATVVNVDDHMKGLHGEAKGLQQTLQTRQRGFFTPSEDDCVLHLWVSYHKSRAALLELIESSQRRLGEASEDNAREFAVAYAAALVLVDAARCLRNLFGENVLVRRKLNEEIRLYGIQAGSFDLVQLSLTDPTNALAIRKANEFFDLHRDYLHTLAADDSDLGAVLDVIETRGHTTRVSTGRYLRARLLEKQRDARERIFRGNVLRLVYAIQEWGSRLVSNISTMPNHVPQLPPQIIASMSSILLPGDILVTRKDCAVTNYFLPGYWPHVAMYIGNNLVIESLKDGVRERSMESPFGNDSAAVIRPQLDPATIQQAIHRAKNHVGKPYDFDFDFTRADRLVCTEVVYRGYEGLGGIHFELKRRAGRETLSAEDLLSLAIRRRGFDEVAVYCSKFGDQLLSGAAMTNVLRGTMAEGFDAGRG